MYTVSVPVMNSNVKKSGREQLLKELRLFDAECVVLALDTYETGEQKRKEVMEELADNCRFL